MPNRQIPPTVHLPAVTSLPPARHWTLSNGLRVIAVGGATQPIIGLNVVFNAGRPYERQRLVARATNQLIAEGTRRRNGAALEEYFEFYGTSLRTPNLFDVGSLEVYTIHDHLAKVLPVFAEVMIEPAFSEKEFVTFVKRSRQGLREDLTDPDTIAYRYFTEFIFGEQHPYGYNGSLQDYSALRLADVKAHYARTYGAQNATLIVSGQLNQNVENLIERYLGQLPLGALQVPESLVEQTARPGVWQLHRPKAQQTLIRRGQALFTRNHPDYPGMSVLNTIFGGYFGSRLMRNIREDKGYTYGIESGIDFMRFGGFLTISADVANENLTNVRREINREIEKLRTDLIPETELGLVRSYLLGSLLGEIDGPLNVAQRYQLSEIEAVSPDHFAKLLDTIRHISSQELRELAQKYLRLSGDWEVIVGGAKQLDEARSIIPK
ncbi:MAG: pitrilysin family protein [Bacteroidota bacterium]